MARNRWGDEIKRGAVVKVYTHGAWQKGIVLRLQPHSNFSRAYGRQAEVGMVFGKKTQTCSAIEAGINDMKKIGTVKRIPKICKGARSR